MPPTPSRPIGSPRRVTGPTGRSGLWCPITIGWLFVFARLIRMSRIGGRRIGACLTLSPRSVHDTPRHRMMRFLPCGKVTDSTPSTYESLRLDRWTRSLRWSCSRSVPSSAKTTNDAPTASALRSARYRNSQCHTAPTTCCRDLLPQRPRYVTPAGAATGFALTCSGRPTAHGSWGPMSISGRCTSGAITTSSATSCVALQPRPSSFLSNRIWSARTDDQVGGRRTVLGPGVDRERQRRAAVRC